MPEATPRGDHVVALAHALHPPVPVNLTPAEARRLMLRSGLRFLTVVAGDPSRLVGVVTQASLQRADCCENAAGGCWLAAHLARGGGFCFATEDMATLRRGDAEEARESPEWKRSLPLIVVDRELKPVGFLPVEEAAEPGMARPSAA